MRRDAAVEVDGEFGRRARVAGWPLRVTPHQLQRSPVTIGQPRPMFVCENPALLRVAALLALPGAVPWGLAVADHRPAVARLEGQRPTLRGPADGSPRRFCG